MSLLDIRNLSVSFRTPQGLVKAAQKVSLTLESNETLALVGETGCGKSVVVNAIMKLLPANAKVDGRVIYRGRDLLSLEEKEMAQIRGQDIAIIFQNPSLALNPVYKISEQVSESMILKKRSSRSRAEEISSQLLQRLGLKGRESSYPFQLSGGMNQRAMIACSVVLGPKIIIADEPTKGLDQSMVGQVLGEIRKAKEVNGASLLLITHDMEVARQISDKVAVMYCGEVMEVGKTEEVLQAPSHPYTQALLDSLPERGFLPIPGPSPSMIDPPEGCRFHPRCPWRRDLCSIERPVQKSTTTGWVRCCR